MGTDERSRSTGSAARKCDVLVVGGGSAGLAAAVAAARLGARTVLVERHGALGGMATAALVHSLCGLYLLRKEPGVVFANPGFAAEFASRLIATGGAHGAVRIGRVDVLPHHPTGFALLADEIALETSGLETRLHSEVIAAFGEAAIDAVEVCCRGRRETIMPRVVVDASGDAVVAALAGAGFEQADADRLQRPAFIFALQGVAPGALDEARRVKIAHRIASAVRAGRLPSGALGASFHGTGRNGEAFVTVDLEGPPVGEYDPTDPACLSALEMHGRALAVAIAEHLRTDVDGFAASYIAAFPSRVGVRESRRMRGRRRIETADVVSGARSPEGVAVGAWPMEMRERATGLRLRFPDGDRPYDIPLGALRAERMRNLLVAGRCIAASHEAQASLRVIGTCLATGEAAGLAAALLAERPGLDDDIELARAVVSARERVMLPHTRRTSMRA